MADADEHGEKLSSPWIELRPGATLGDRYVIEKMIGRGGIGAVFLASDRNLLGRRVVIKVLLDEISQSNTGDYFRRKFRHEMQALSRINHPGVVGILDAGSTPDGGAFLVMEYVDGITLRAELDDLIRNHIEGMPFDRAAHIIRQVGQALSAAHARNVHHRDLKPENIMIETSGDGEQQVKIIDFGIASITDSQTFKTSTAIIGTIAYMAPEQFLRKPSAASDIFALGVIAYEMLTGRRPFNPPTQFQALDVLKQGLRVKPSALRPDLPPAAEEIILRALSFEERDRPAKAKDLGDGLALALTAPLKGPFPEPSELAPPPDGPARSGTEPIGSHSSSPAQVEMAHVLSLEMMEFSRLKTQQQLHLVRELQRIVRDTEEFRSATRRKEVICRSAGYAMKIVFRRDPESPARCAIQIARAAREHEHIRLRMGIHSGLVAVHEDINFNIDAAGAGINTAQSIMECGDAGHILVSSSARDLLDEAGEWASSLADLGEWEIRPGERVRLFNFCAEGA
ncbi:MAG TPA: protein kinase, partial [Blastocatellia bacterium]|nr:protein kinase [Blastocatellia bacterium]